MTLSSTSNSEEPLRQRARQSRGWSRAMGSVILVTFLFPASVAGAVEYTAARKAGRGLAAMTCAFLEIPGNIVTETEEHGAAQGFALGLTLGLGNMVLRTLVGVFELVSSPFPVPEGFKPIIEPEFPWGYFDDAKP